MISPIQIRRDDVVKDIRMLAEITGVSITEAVASAVRTQLASERGKAEAKLSSRRKRIESALAELRRLPVVGPGLSDRDIYGPDGLPR
jgi:hypothetical protein